LTNVGRRGKLVLEILPIRVESHPTYALEKIPVDTFDCFPFLSYTKTIQKKITVQRSSERSHRSRSGSRSRDRERRRRKRRHEHGRHRTKSRSRSGSPRHRHRSRSRSGSSSVERNLNDDGAASAGSQSAVNYFEMPGKEAEKKLDEEMRKRKERIERWRAERRAQLIASGQIDIVSEAKINKPSKAWTLEDDAEDDESDLHTELNNSETNKPQEPVLEEQDEPDPLDVFMQEVHQQIRQTRGIDPTATGGAGSKGQSKVVLVTKVNNNNKSKDSINKKGDIVEQNADALEYSDEEQDVDIEQAISSLAAQAKQLPITNHDKVYYRAFRKNFYVEVADLAKMSQEEVDAYREQLEGIRVRGKNCPKPIKNWAQTGSSRRVMDLLKKYNYEKPTPIQAQAIPAILCGRDVIGIAKTGSGKTLAFLIPMFRHVLDQPPLDDMDGPIALIMTPTRELAMQIAKECKKFSRPLNLSTVCVYGGTGISEQIAELKRGAEIIVCTPGRMIDMLAANNGKVTNLRRVTYLVLDEADRMFDMGFEPQVLKIIGNIRPDRQTVMFSATFPRQMEALARKVLEKPIEIIVGNRSTVCQDVEQHAIIVDEEHRFLKLLELLGVYYELGNILIFVDKQEHADELVADLMRAGYICAPLHGGLDQFDRDSTIVDFKNGVITLLIATSVAARGLDVKNMILVVNYDCPNHYEDYVHRVGRCGRAGNKGFAYTFIQPYGQEVSAGNIVRAFELAGQEVPPGLKLMWETYKQQMALEGKEVKHGGGGYGGHGFRFDEAEAEAVKSKRSIEKLVLGLQGSDDDEEDIDQQIQSLMKSTRRVTEGSVPLASSSSGAATTNQSALEKAKQLARQINLEKNIGVGAKDVTQQTAEAVMKGATTGPVNVSAKTIAQQLAGKLNEKLNYIPTEMPQQEQQQTFSRYEEELEINDFPQQVRWKITSRDSISQIQEYAEVGISVKGSYVPAGKEPKEGERRLYLCIEAASELAITRARNEIIRVLKEELRKLASLTSAQTYNKAKYKVV
ncbi:putative ATP-dependent RNA helicase DDX46, partial [Trichinella sp. T6]